MKSVMKHNFSQIPKADIPRSSFNRSSGYKTTFDAGLLIPCYVDEVYPGDTVNLGMTHFCRLNTPLVPFMDNMFLDTHFFFVPTRLVWDNWQKFNGEQRNPGDSTDFLVPQIVSPGGGYVAESIYDYMGIPTEVPGLSHSALPLRCYNLIYNEWYRDENLQGSVPTNTGDGPDNHINYALQFRGKRHDYFSSCLPWPQKGPAVQLPLGTTAPVVSDNTAIRLRQISTVVDRDMTLGSGNALQYTGASLAGAGTIFGSQTGLRADLSTATAATINSLRQAFQIQKLYERDARGGTRYTEIIRAHFGVISPDARLQRPEYLGGGTTPLNIHPIAQNSESGTTPLGTLGAMGTAAASNQGFVKSFTEHGFIIGIISARADLNYQQGLDRMWSRKSRFDFYWPALSHIGEQAVLNKEIYAVGSANPTQDAAVFGYQERFAELRYKQSQVTGRYRSNYAQSLDMWHLAQDFANLPVLGNAFIVENPPMNRVVAVPTEPDFLLDSYFHAIWARPMPTYSVPGLVDHF